MGRIEKLCSYLLPCKAFADVACDHGYVAEYMLKNGLCESVTVSDISEKCLNKAKKLLESYLAAGKCRAVCCDGLERIDKNTDCVLIAGIGGEEIIKILKEGFIPKSFVFQPMKNVRLVREYLLENGCAIDRDDLFSDGKNFYFVICGRREGETEKYSEQQLEYGRDSFKGFELRDYLKSEAEKLESYLSRIMKAESRAELENRIKEIKEVINETYPNI